MQQQQQQKQTNVMVDTESSFIDNTDMKEKCSACITFLVYIFQFKIENSFRNSFIESFRKENYGNYTITRRKKGILIVLIFYFPFSRENGMEPLSLSCSYSKLEN